MQKRLEDTLNDHSEKENELRTFRNESEEKCNGKDYRGFK